VASALREAGIPVDRQCENTLGQRFPLPAAPGQTEELQWLSFVQDKDASRASALIQRLPVSLSPYSMFPPRDRVSTVLGGTLTALAALGGLVTVVSMLYCQGR